MPDLYIIAGPNGAGKTTAAMTVLPETFHVKEFVNADEIARGLSPLNPGSVALLAGRLMLRRIKQLLAEKQNFAFETTLSTKSYLPLIRLAIQNEYLVTLLFLWLNDIELAKERVNKRVKEGGHDIPAPVIERRFKRGLENLPSFMELANSWYLYDNSSGDFSLIAKEINGNRKIINFELWQRMIK